jgi:molybdenum cofactor guanylyltransferase
MNILGAIIAGGTSRRMGGREKAFVELGGVPLIDRVHSRIRFQVHSVIINANGDASRFARFGLPVVPDLIATVRTPLAGLHAALSYAVRHRFDAVLTVPSDSPFLPLDLVDRLEEEGRSTGGAVAVSGGQTHYLTGLWSSALMPVLSAAVLEEGLMRVQEFERKVFTASVMWPTTPHDPFMNINTPDDLAAAETQLHD